MKLGTMFSGGGLVDIGAMQAGVLPVWAIEYDPAIAEVYRRNVGDHIIVADVADVDYGSLANVDWLHASTSCINASGANQDGGETAGDLRSAGAVVTAIRTNRPQFFTLENVWGYRNFQSFRMILNCLGEMGYFYDFNHLRMDHYGVPQKRWRLVLVASRGLLPTIQTAKSTGWKAAIEDLIPGLQETAFPSWQLEKLKNNRLAEFVINGQNSTQEYTISIVPPHRPIFTITASFRKAATRMKIDGRVLTADRRCLARWQTMPDSYILPTNNQLSGTIIGNGVPCEFARRLATSLIEVAQ